MKRENVSLSGICLRAVLLFCALFAFSACGDDDEETTPPAWGGGGGGGNTPTAASIVGNWLMEEQDGDYYLGELYVFDEDGHYRLEYCEGYGGDYDTGEEGGEYYYANGNLVLIPSYGVSEEEFADGYTYSVPVLTEERLVLREEDGDTYAYMRTSRTSLPEPPGIGGGEEQSAIVGNWLAEDEGYNYTDRELWVFRADGTFTLMIEYVEDEVRNYYEAGGNYRYVNGRLMVEYQYSEPEGEFVGSYTYEVPTLTENRLELREPDGDTYMYERTTMTSLPTTPEGGGGTAQRDIVGSWFAEDASYDYTDRELWVFRADGTFTYYVKYTDSYGNDNYEVGGNYRYTNGRLTVMPTYTVPDDEPEETMVFDVISLSDTHLALRDEYGDAYEYERTNRTSLFTSRTGNPAEKIVKRTNRPHGKRMNPFQKY